MAPAPQGVEFTGADGTVLRLSSTVPLEAEGPDGVATFTLRAGETATFVLEQVTDRTEYPTDLDQYVSSSFKTTMNFWRDWIGRSTYTGRWRDEVHRSALALKLLNARWSGSIVAAATFGLPETIGGVRNWDYRYSWIRDASFTLYALSRLGMTDETGAFIAWLADRFESAHPDSLRTLYTIAGGTDVAEHTLDHLEGYRGSRPVRIGNAAIDQLQLDIYGELLDAIYLFDKYKESTSFSLWKRIAGLVEWVVENWRAADDGVWEVRSGKREFLYSRILCWVAIDRGLRLAVKRSFPAPVERWREARDAIYREVHESFWDPKGQTFIGVKGTTRLDAACLIMPLVRFISATDPRWLDPPRGGGTAGGGFAGLSLRDRGSGHRRVGRGGGQLLDLFLLVHRMLVAIGRSTEGAVSLREDAGLCQPPRAVRGGDRAGGRALGELPPGVYPPGVDQCGVRSGPAADQGGSPIVESTWSDPVA